MSFSEKALEEIINIVNNNPSLNLFEAASEFCEMQDIDPEIFVASLDKSALRRIKQAAVDGAHVRKVDAPKKKKSKVLFSD